MGTLAKLSGQLGRESRYYYHQRVSNYMRNYLSTHIYLLKQTKVRLLLVLVKYCEE